MVYYEKIRDLSRLKHILNPTIVEDIQKESVVSGMKYYVRKLIVRRFLGRKHNPDYPSLTIKYLKWKRRRVGVKPTMVLYGKLKQAVLKSQTINGKNGPYLKQRYPPYAKYLKKQNASLYKNARFDFLSPKNDEPDLIVKEVRKSFRNLRAKQLRAGRK